MNREDFAVRPYIKEDYNSVMKLWQATGLGNPARGDNEAVIGLSLEIGGKLFILEQKVTKELCGTSWLTFDGRRFHLHHFGIAPSYQGKGLSKMLLEETLRFVKEKGIQVKLEVHQDNEKAIKLYKKYGFSYLGDYRVYIIRDINTI
jgi:ribosomal protein S18 acetylase RimI-like enzyme